MKYIVELQPHDRIVLLCMLEKEIAGNNRVLTLMDDKETSAINITLKRIFDAVKQAKP